MKIKVFSTPTCPFCIALKNFLEEHNIQFEYLDVAENEAAREEMIKKSGQMGVPVVDIDGEIIIGFDQDRIKELLKIKD